MSYRMVRKKLRSLANSETAVILQRFFKTGSGQYGEGDKFLGIKVPQLRKVAKEFQDLKLSDVQKLLHSSNHEERLLAIIFLVNRFSTADEKTQERVYQLYLKNTRYINNWDLVDLSAHHIVGAYLFSRAKKLLYALAVSNDLWERRIAMLSTFYYIKRSRFQEALKISKILLYDEHDLIHKAVGWMLREIGKRDLAVEEDFLKSHYKKMPRTMLRYAIERFPESKRKRYLVGTI
ncbi:MAG: DNA alkylation repair protein [Gammaproteobacteria bacterium RIFCSPHIGHO2_02_FULL_42_13]|nr:MAG: DNA alkylation repair protein [Gammaproteobacteria bacterium RIFCSPHIGHO2_02_FULL_42_13]HLB57911.1 DNA alkylation repair protein [Gammaproteobacteria bacterium]